ncbi:MAG: hypothetical protein K8S99_00635 [Planctomycetes bacterium]|nr:hypothetical protein [Planctomycetota bacterium]
MAANDEHGIDEATYDSFTREWHRVRAEAEPPGGLTAGIARCPAKWLVGELMMMLAGARGRPLRRIRPTVHRLMEARDLLDRRDDRSDAQTCQVPVAHEVDLVMRTLQRVRAGAMEDHVLSLHTAGPAKGR